MGERLGLKAGTLRVLHSVEWRKGHAQLCEPKSDTSRRTVKLPGFAIKALEKHRTRQKRERLIAGAAWKESDLVFTSTVGTLPDYANVRRELMIVCRAAGVAGLTLHGLRHTCATLLLVQGAHPKLVRGCSQRRRDGTDSRPWVAPTSSAVVGLQCANTRLRSATEPAGDSD